MTNPDPEELLWKLSSTDRDDPDATVDFDRPPDETLLAYREGRLEDSEAQRIETQLAHSSAARERLIELAGVTLAQPSAALRARLVPQPRRQWWAASAAAAAVCLLALGLYLGQPSEPREVPAFDVSVELLAEVRSAAPARPGTDPETVPGTTREVPGTTREVYADTPVRIVMEPTEDAVAGLEFGLYIRRDKGPERRLEHLAPGAGFSLETHRGTAVFAAAASRLLGTTPGSYELFVVAANRLPATVEITPGSEPQTSLAAATGGRIYLREITLLPDPQ